MTEAIDSHNALAARMRAKKCRVLAFVWSADSPSYWSETLPTIQELDDVDEIVFFTRFDVDFVRYAYPKSSVIAVREPDLVAELAWLDANVEFDQVLVVHAPVVLPPAATRRAVRWMRAEPRLGTVSFLSNVAGYLSFPQINCETRLPGRHSGVERTLSRLLRCGYDSGPVPIPIPDGSAVLISRSALHCVAPRAELGTDPKLVLADFALRAAARGFGNYLDAGTFVYHPGTDGGTRIWTEENRRAANARHWHFPAIMDQAATSAAGPLRIALDVALSKVAGLRVLIDGSCLGPLEMGTQTALLALVARLADESRISSLRIGIPGTGVPFYAKSAFSNPKIECVPVDDLRFGSVESVDILHRPFQAEPSIPWERWRKLAKRIVITILDLIAFKNATYFDGWQSWADYRSAMYRAAESADSIIAISADVRNAICQEALPVPEERLVAIPLGVDHIDGQALAHPPRFPRALAGSGLTSKGFALVLGTDYAHKNRDLAIRAFDELRARGHDLSLVLAGAAVPHGGTRSGEASVTAHPGTWSVGDVSTGERNWLLKHAAFVLYPTASEGFGLVPFEAAYFGTPTVFVSFGPLRELIGDDAQPTGWSADALADRAEELLYDADAREAALGRLSQRRADLGWAVTARKTVDVYTHALTLPPRGARL